MSKPVCEESTMKPYLDPLKRNRLLTDKEITARLSAPNRLIRYGRIIRGDGSDDIIGFAKGERGAAMTAVHYFRAYLPDDRDKVNMQTVTVRIQADGEFVGDYMVGCKI
jgi:hypothetical protein